MERHHIVFRSQGGLNFPLNFIDLTTEEHKGNNGPHLNREMDLYLKKSMQAQIQNKLSQAYYTTEQLIKELELRPTEAHKMTKHLTLHKEGYATEDVIRRLMGGKLYG